MLRYLFCLATVAIAASFACELAAADKPVWKAGLAKRSITQETAVWLAGYGSKRPPDGKLHDIWMKAVALEDDQGHKAVLITSDFQGVPKLMSDPVFAQAKEKFGLERHQIMFTFSHNHCGPRLGDDLIDYYPVEEEQEKLVDEYTAKMVVDAVAMIGEALKNLAPANLATGMGHCTFAVNRRNNREADVPMLIEKNMLVGPVDHNVPVLTVTRPDGKVDAILFGYACHPTVMSYNTINGDYPGFAQLEIESAHPGAMAMFVNTCGGDQNPLPRRKIELSEKYGRSLALSVQSALKEKMTPISAGLKTAFEYVDLPYLKVMTVEEFKALETDTGIKGRWARRLLKKQAMGHKFESAYPYPIHAWQLGKETLFIGMGAETVVDYALKFKSEFGESTWVMGYADDMISYIPSKRVWLEGGYEGGSNLYEYGRPAMRWGEDTEALITATVHKLVKEVKK